MKHNQEYKLQVVNIGKIEIGDKNPIAIQSMTNTNTLDTDTTVEQIIKIVDAGADIVRVSTPTIKDAENLKNIKSQLQKKGYDIPLVADIHFNPKIAHIAAEIVDKIRINPGNFSERKKKPLNENSDNFFQKEFETIKEYFIPLIKTCKNNNTAIRIGVNHGSLSERIINKYGDTPEGMVESAMEYIQICKDVDFHNIVLSLKSSNTRIMVYANRLLHEKMKETGIVYPIHAGVTEAGSGEDGRLKSAVGIGALLSEGIGNTIRVSLTEAPEKEIPIAKKILKYSDNYKSVNHYKSSTEYNKRKTFEAGEIGGDNKFAVITKSTSEIGKNSSSIDKYFYIDENTDTRYPMFYLEDLLYTNLNPNSLNFVSIPAKKFSQEHISKLNTQMNIALVLSSHDCEPIDDYYKSFEIIKQNNSQIPIIIKRNYFEKNYEDLQLECATELGGLLIDGYGEGLWLENDEEMEQGKLNEFALGLLQASRLRFSKPEYISCPSCSRTLFDIEKICEEIKTRTSNIKNIKIAIMGCIVNGPGEMADADYGYVGSGFGKVTLYKGKNIIKKNIPEADAIDELIKNINEYN